MLSIDVSIEFFIQHEKLLGLSFAHNSIELLSPFLSHTFQLSLTSISKKFLRKDKVLAKGSFKKKNYRKFLYKKHMNMNVWGTSYFWPPHFLAKECECTERYALEEKGKFLEQKSCKSMRDILFSFFCCIHKRMRLRSMKKTLLETLGKSVRWGISFYAAHAILDHFKSFFLLKIYFCVFAR